MRTARRNQPMLTLTAAVIAVVAAFSERRCGSPPPPATGHAAVIAQGNVEFTDGSYRWSASSEVYDAGAPAIACGRWLDTFFAVTAGALVAADGETPIARVGAGEATFVRKDATTTVMPADGAAANRLGLGTGGAGGAGDPFAPGPGVRDVDLVRDVLDPGGTLAIADSEAAPKLVVVVTGSVTVAGDPAGSADVTAATPDTFDGNLTLVNGGSEPAVVLVAVVGTLVQTTAGVRRLAPTNGGGGPTEPGEPDADGDGLSDADEAERGTMPNDPDSDGDDLTDGDEVHRYGTDPLSSRTDFDHLEDGLEIEREPIPSTTTPTTTDARTAVTTIP